MVSLADGDRETLLLKARLAEQAERYDDMVTVTRTLTMLPELDSELTPEERNLLSVAYKSKVGLRRTSWRNVLNLEQKYNIDSKQRSLAKEYRDLIEQELTDCCNDIIRLLDEYVLPKTTTAEADVFLLKMKGDYYRYMAEIKLFDKEAHNNNSIDEIAHLAMCAYQGAHNIAMDRLTATNPVRLGLALNYSVFYYEIKNSPDEACKLARQAFDDASADLDSLDEFTYKDSTVIMQLLRDNLTLWTATELEISADNNSKTEDSTDDEN